MIRPFTFVCMLMAAGSGLYLYQAKHRSQLLDQEIAKVLNAADANRERMRVLRAEYGLLQDPSRMEELAAQHLALVKTDPKQYVTWATFEKQFPVSITPPQAPNAAPDTAPGGAAATALVGGAVAPAAPVYGPRAPVPLPALAAAAPASPAMPAARAEPSAAPAASATAAPASPRPVPVPAAVHPAPSPAPEPALVASAAPAQHGATAVARAEAVPFAGPRVATPAPQRVALSTRRPAYVPPPTTSAEAIAHVARGGIIDPGVPAFASALGMARALASPNFIPPASGTGWISNGAGG
jgi:hypothetical protein